MSLTAARLDPFRWLGLPMLACIVAALLLAAPVRVFGLRLPEPVWAMVPAFAWAVIRPSFLAPFAVLVMGLFYDAFWGGPLGLWVLSLMLVYAGVVLARSILVGQSKLIMWLWYAGMTAVAMGAGYLFCMIATATAPNPMSVLWQYLVTAALYPLADRLIERFEDADVRFR